MPTLAPNVINRVDKLPKPSNIAQAMQPLFEAVSNAIFAIEDIRNPPPKAVCRDLLISFKSIPYVMRYSHFPH
ncbi:hypothetical protein [Agrobacterium tumefaciens]|uniref:hypothetical protein n=1 Tax=Agrobacterium tumefaciens TaxID=358 RepID=UPI00157218D7|nr:hypothetical protein [Agrobacterium tumefaciens]WCK05896.1 hypothetical protein G6L31_024660 [Agrobacterium tumefaciens]